MRPRVFPAEDASWSGWRHLRQGASMRPRVFPAEDRAVVGPCAFIACRFNEAAGIPRGRRLATPKAISGLPSSCFNEAAGIPRGRLLMRPHRLLPWTTLQ